MVETIEIPEGFKQTGIGIIPRDWELKKLEEVADVKTGPFGSALHERDYVKDGTPIITVEHLGEQGVMHENLPMVSDSDRKRLKAYVLKIGDIVFSRVGSVDRNSLIREKEDGWLFSGRLLRIRVKNKNISPSYLSYHFHQETTKQRIRSVAVGQTMASLNTQILKDVLVALPPTKAEQTAIATALHDADALISSVEQLIAKKRHIKQGAMQELLKPKEGWAVKKLGEIVDKFVNGGTPSTEVDKYWKGNIPWISGADVLNQQIGQIRRYITEEAVKNSSTNVIKKGNLLFVSRTGVGKLAIAPFDIAISQDFTGIYVNNNFLVTEFLYRYFDFISKELQNQNQGTSIQGITRETLSNFPIPVPQLEEQTRITQILSDMDAEIEALEQQLEKYKMMKQGMMQNLLTGRIRLA